MAKKTAKTNGRATETYRSKTFTMQPPDLATVEDVAEQLEQQAASLRGSLAKRWEAEDRSRRAGLALLLQNRGAEREVARIRAEVA